MNFLPSSSISKIQSNCDWLKIAAIRESKGGQYGCHSLLDSGLKNKNYLFGINRVFNSFFNNLLKYLKELFFGIIIKMNDIIAIGSATRDAFFKVNFKLTHFLKAASGWAYLLPLGEKLEVEDVFFTIGGNAINASVTFSRQGLRTACLAKIGEDVSGEEIRRRLKKEGVSLNLLIQTSKKPTAYSVLLLSSGERTILNYRGASDTLDFSDLDFKKLKSRWWYVSLTGRSIKIFQRLIKFASKNNISVAVNPSGYHLSHRPQEILASLKDITFLVLNEEEAARLTGISFKKEKEVFKKLDKLMPGILAVTNGKKGATISDGRFVYKVDTFQEKKLVDRTGAGDAFGSGFTAFLVQKGFNRFNISQLKPEDVIGAAQLASANATAVVEKMGATEGILTKEEFQNPRWKNLKIRIKRI